MMSWLEGQGRGGGGGGSLKRWRLQNGASSSQGYLQHCDHWYPFIHQGEETMWNKASRLRKQNNVRDQARTTDLQIGNPTC